MQQCVGERAHADEPPVPVKDKSGETEIAADENGPLLVRVFKTTADPFVGRLTYLRVLSATPREVFLRIRVPNALPYLFSALKIAASTAVIGAIVGEWIGSTRGIGALIIQSTYNFDSPLLYATIVVGSTFSALFFGVISLAERRMLRWNVTHNA